MFHSSIPLEPNNLSQSAFIEREFYIAEETFQRKSRRKKLGFRSISFLRWMAWRYLRRINPLMVSSWSLIIWNHQCSQILGLWASLTMIWDSMCHILYVFVERRPIRNTNSYFRPLCDDGWWRLVGPALGREAYFIYLNRVLHCLRRTSSRRLSSWHAHSWPEARKWPIHKFDERDWMSWHVNI